LLSGIVLKGRKIITNSYERDGKSFILISIYKSKGNNWGITAVFNILSTHIMPIPYAVTGGESYRSGPLHAFSTRADEGIPYYRPHSKKLAY
jgi:hypothetical protein